MYSRRSAPAMLAPHRRSHTLAASVLLTTTLALAGCSGTDLSLENLPLATNEPAAVQTTAEAQFAPHRAAGKQPQETTGVLAEAHTLRKAGKKIEAMARLDKAPANEQDRADVQKTRAMLALELGQLDKAQGLLQKLAKQDPRDWRLHSALGAAYSAQGRQQDAQVALARALELAPDNPAVLNNLALSYALDSKPQQAEALLRKVMDSGATKTHVDRARQNLALLLGLNGRLDESQKIGRATLPEADTKTNLRILSQASPTSPPPQKSARSQNFEGPVYRLGGPSTD